MENFSYTGLVHIRKLDEQNFDASTHGGITFVYNLVRGDVGELSVDISYSLCSEKDNFNRKIGRAIAVGRMNAGSAIRYEAIEFISLEDLQRVQESIKKVSNTEVVLYPSNTEVLYIREVDYPLLSVLLNTVFQFYATKLFHEEVEIIKLGNNYVAVPLETDEVDWEV